MLWDREFGFLKEIMVAPVSRMSLVLGRIAGGATTSMIQGLLIFGASARSRASGRGAPALLAFGFVFMLLIAFTFIGLGLIFASRMKDMQGFGIVMNFIIFPFFFLSGALTPLENFPWFIRALSYVDPLTYGVDGLRAVLIGTSSLPVARRPGRHDRLRPRHALPGRLFLREERERLGGSATFDVNVWEALT